MLMRQALVRECDRCGRSYRTKHTCFGTGQRRRNVELHVIDNGQNARFSALPSSQPARAAEHPIILIENHPSRHVNPQPDLESRASTAHQRSILLRLRGNISDSENMIRDFLSELRGVESPSNKLAALHLSQAGNHMYHFRFNDAHDEIKCAMSLSKTQPDLLWNQMLCLSRALRGSGEFHAARTVLQLCVTTPDLSRPKRCLVASALSDVLCELSVTEHDKSHLIQAEELLTPQIASFRALPNPGSHPKGLRRLLLALVEVKILQHSHHEARCLALELLDTYSKLGNLDIIDRVGHVRTLIAFARIATTPKEAISSWMSALSWNKFYNPDEEEVFTCGAAYLVLCSLWLKLGDLDTAQDYFAKGTNVLAKKQRQFLIPGLGTYIFDEACAEIRDINVIRTIN